MGAPVCGEAPPDCRLSPPLAEFCADNRRRHAANHNAPVPAFGDAAARLLVLGLAPGLHGANRTARPFTGDHAGLLIYQTLQVHGFADQPASLGRDDGLKLHGCRTMPCAVSPPQNKRA